MRPDVVQIGLQAALFPVEGSSALRPEWRLLLCLHTRIGLPGYILLQPHGMQYGTLLSFSVSAVRDPNNVPGAVRVEQLSFPVQRKDRGIRWPTAEELVSLLVNRRMHRAPAERRPEEDYFHWALFALHMLSKAEWLMPYADMVAAVQRESVEAQLSAISLSGETGTTES
ncbi:hypothetical protein CALCODRAFT_484844 [Calocera cornea HHB12733]|uniref:Uncharacterized protein n=1 Tax=Calocera cornea HHB12733 TaxID=1353952 RepID=A0A165ERK9_9BASI|nr:hypothetical protein CALCODRAFT_484844 [Calocera cornea HHB12733]